MSAKISVTVIKAQNIGADSDIPKLHMHLVNLLQEKEGVDLKTRNSLTEATIKGSDYIVLCGTDSATVSEYFKCISVVEGSKEVPMPKVFFYDVPGSWVEDDINALLRSMSDHRRVNVTVFENTFFSWNYRDIIGFVETDLKKVEKLISESQPVV